MSAIPKELLLFSQIFGALPLTYSRGPKNGPSLKFSKILYAKNVLTITLMTMLSIVGLWVDYDAYLTGKPVRMVHSINVIAVFLDVTFLNLMSVAVFVSSLRHYASFINLCDILERVDRALRVTLNLRSWLLKVFLTALYITSIIVNTEVRLSSVGWKSVWHVFDLLHYYVQGALFLQFTFVAHSFSRRFRLINKMFQREIFGQSVGPARLTHLVKTAPAPGNLLLNDRLKLLINSYSRLCEAVQQANTFYGSQLLAAVSSSFVHNIITLYFFIQEVRPNQAAEDGTSMLNEIIWVFTHVTHLILLVWPCTQLTEAASETAPIICRLLSRDVVFHNTALRQQLETFLLELLHYQVGFSALGFFKVHNQILTSITSSVATYLVIMIQFRTDN